MFRKKTVKVLSLVFIMTSMSLSWSDDHAEKIIAASKAANEAFDKNFMKEIMLSPIYQTYMGIKKDYGKWDEVGEKADKARLERQKGYLADLQKIDTSLLDEQTLLSYRLLEQSLKNDIEDYQYRLYNYPVNQMFGAQSNAPSLLINQHLVSDLTDAKAYISRLNNLPTYFDQVMQEIKIREKAGILAPKFVYQYVIKDSQNIIKGQPFEISDEKSTLLEDFTKKVYALTLSEEEKSELVKEAITALREKVKPAYEKLIALMQDQEKRANTDAGVWKFPQGDAFYKNALARTTTTDLSADEIHELGLKEVARIHKEMRALMKQVNFKGSLTEFFTFMRTDKQFYLAETQAGKDSYITEVKRVLGDMEKRLPEVFNVLPKAELKIKPVEPFREKSAGMAFYQQPAPDGSRPGIYYANLYKMSEMPTYELEALAFHEALPGHHMQISIAQELEGLPKFRRFGGYTAYVEGWGLYSEYLPKEMGFYQDPYSDFGRLSMELWRACRLVVDTGLHQKKWSREKAIQYLKDNTPSPEGNVVKAIERYIVMPSQATAYKVGMLKILTLREKAKKALGKDFDIRYFHDVVLKNGPVPLYILEEEVDKWINTAKS